MHTDWSDSIVIADLADEPALSDELNALIERTEAAASGKVPNVVLNCQHMTYLNSSNIAQLLRLRSRLKEHNRVMRICSVSDEVWILILATGLDRVFSFSPDPMTALAGLQLEEAEAEGE